MSPVDRGRATALRVAAVVLALVGVALVGWAAAHQTSAPSVPLSDATSADPGTAGTTGTTAPWMAATAAPPAGPPVLAPSPPSGLRIPAIGVDAPFGSAVGLEPDRTMEVPPPGPAWDLPAWYRYSVTPGERGPAVVVGHVDSHVTGPSVFFDLARLRPGQVVEVARGDGSTARFAVRAVQRFAKDAFPTDAVYAGTAGPELRLITCGGAFDTQVRSYRDNTVVFAVGLPPA